MNKPAAISVSTAPALKILLVRSGATELDAQGRITGTLDLPMCAEAEADVKRTAAQLSFSPVDVIYSAASEASRQTAKILSMDRKLKVRVSTILTNLDCGLWHGKRIDEVKQTQPTLFRKWVEMANGFCPPNGETFADARDRVVLFLKRVQKKHPTGTIVVVAPQPLLSVIHGVLDPDAEVQPWAAMSESGKWECVTGTNIRMLSPAESPIRPE